MNFFISDIQTLNADYPQAYNQETQTYNKETAKRFKSLSEYLVIAERVIKRFAPSIMPRYAVTKMLSSEDAISEVARHMMMADWSFKEGKGRTQHSWRNQAAIYAIRDFGNLFKRRANKSHISLDNEFCSSRNGNHHEVSFYEITEDILAKQPDQVAEATERIERVSDYVQFLIQNSNLTPVQEKCLKLRFIEGIDSYVEMGKKFDPPISRQASAQNLSRALFKIRQSALGSNK